MTMKVRGECVGVPYYGSDSAAETNLDIHRRSSWSTTTVDDVIVEDSVCLVFVLQLVVHAVWQRHWRELFDSTHCYTRQ